MKTFRSSRVRVWCSLTLMVIIYVGTVYQVYLAYATSDSNLRWLALGMAMALVPFVLVSILGVSSLIAKSVRYFQLVRANEVTPEMRELIASVALGGGDEKRLRSLARQNPETLEVIISEFLSSFEGETRTELIAMAIELGCAENWRRASHSRDAVVQKKALINLGRIGYRIDPALLRHHMEQTRIEAACAMLASGAQESPGLVFGMLPDQSLLGRILLAESLRPYAGEICAKYLLEDLKSGDKRRVKASLEMLRAWERSIPIEHFSELIASLDMETQIAALAALPYATAKEEETTQEILNLLDSSDESAHAAAAKAAAEVGISVAVPRLLRQLRNDGPASALAAASALARLGQEGKDLLETEILTSSRPEFALQALEQSLVAERI